jgi:hypothetical protein
MNLPAASDGVSTTKSVKGLRGKPRGMHPSQFKGCLSPFCRLFCMNTGRSNFMIPRDRSLTEADAIDRDDIDDELVAEILSAADFPHCSDFPMFEKLRDQDYIHFVL